ncbi:hypothetical protein M422DRAFT_276596 [Sphaerobolus stellatus SS14]|uniref:Unplaced genomic scaffold SPHSTscaffold_805, whole genome shotgun sequence n=1 Tax=Sphaerobolus stellatus (strain SS14) TaxID=990650 RepID=A0A0C9U1P4_SPHS4|nr:hypothetical protein M422DRAFT_276596 [Sphaerobolus stellatus SS14]
MSAAASSKTTTANNILYKKAKDVQHLPSIPASDVQRTVRGFKTVPEFTKRWDPRLHNDWAGYKDGEREIMVRGYWRAYDEEYEELEALWLQLTRKEDQEEEQWKSKVEKKKKNKPAAPVALGSGSKKGKRKGKEIEIIGSDSDSEIDMEFWESCVGCERAKVRCVFTHATNGKKVACDQCIDHKTNCTYWSPQDLVVRKELQNIRLSVSSMDVNSEYNLQVINSLQWSLSALANIDRQNIGLRTLDNQLPSDTSVPEDLQDAVVHGQDHVIECYNNIAQMCGAQMKSISSQYGLGKNFGARVPLLNCYGELDLTGEVESGIKKRKAEEAAAEPGPSKRIRKDKEPESGEKEVEKEVEKELGPDPAPVVDKGKGKEKELGGEENGEDTMKE